MKTSALCLLMVIVIGCSSEKPATVKPAEDVPSRVYKAEIRNYLKEVRDGMRIVSTEPTWEQLSTKIDEIETLHKRIESYEVPERVKDNFTILNLVMIGIDGDFGIASTVISNPKAQERKEQTQKALDSIENNLRRIEQMLDYPPHADKTN